eukprot:gene11891-60221_t
MMEPGYSHYKCTWMKQKQWAQHSAPGFKMDALVKQFAGKPGLTPKLFDKFTLHLIVDPGHALPKEVKDVLYYTADKDLARRA